MKPLFLLSAALLGATLCAGVHAQAYPTKPVRLIVPFAPGGGTDLVGRVTAQKLTETLKQTFIVDNRPGAGSTLGSEMGAKAPPDGYTLTVIAGSYGVNPALYKLGFDPVNDITPVIQLSQGPLLVAVTPSLPAKNVKELIALTRSKGGLSYASSGAGSLVHLATEHMLTMAGAKAIHVPYKGTGPALIDTIAGNTQLLLGSMGPTLPQVRNGKLRGIAVTSAARIPALPDMPTVSESGVKGYEVTNWHALIGPKGLPEPIVERLNVELNKIVRSKDMEDKLAVDGVYASGGPPAQLTALIKRDIDRWTKVVQQSGVKATD